jgi:DNA-binding winged helix-turn-helix (wHTH) protein
VSEQVDDLPTHLVPKSLVVSEAFHALGVREALPELIEIIEPISLEGIPGSIVGLIRIGFSGDYAAARIHSQRLALIGGSLGGWLTLMFASAAFLWQIQRRKLSGDPNDLRIRCGTLSIDPDSREVTLNGISLDLTPKLYGLLHLFATHPGTVFSDDDLLRALWSDSTYAASADVKQCIYMLRRTLHEAHPNPRQLICNVKGFGYRLDPDATEDDLTTD